MLNKDEIEEMSRSEMVERIMELQEEKKYSAFDLDEFAEWLGMTNWKEVTVGKWRNMGRFFETKTTAQLREDWEIETGRKEATE